MSLGEVQAARSKALAEAIATVLKDHADHDADRGLVTDWTLVVEQMGADGEPYLRLLHSHDSLQWRRIGMLEYALTVQRGIIYDRDDDA